MSILAAHQLRRVSHVVDYSLAVGSPEPAALHPAIRPKSAVSVLYSIAARRGDGTCGFFISGHLLDPFTNEFDPLGVHEPTSDLRHHGYRIVGRDSIIENRLIGLSRNDVEFAIATTSAGRDRRFQDAEFVRVILGDGEVEPGIPGRSVRLMTMLTIDLNPRTGTLVKCAARGTIPNRVSWRVVGIVRRALEYSPFSPM